MPRRRSDRETLTERLRHEDMPWPRSMRGAYAGRREGRLMQKQDTVVPYSGNEQGTVSAVVTMDEHRGQAGSRACASLRGVRMPFFHPVTTRRPVSSPCPAGWHCC